MVLDAFFPLHAAGHIHAVRLDQFHSLCNVLRRKTARKDHPTECFSNNGEMPIEGRACPASLAITVTVEEKCTHVIVRHVLDALLIFDLECFYHACPKPLTK